MADELTTCKAPGCTNPIAPPRLTCSAACRQRAHREAQRGELAGDVAELLRTVHDSVAVAALCDVQPTVLYQLRERLSEAVEGGSLRESRHTLADGVAQLGRTLPAAVAPGLRTTGTAAGR